MTIKITANQKQIVYDCYLEGMTVEQACNDTKLPFKYVKDQYQNFIVYSAKIKGNSIEDRLNQCRSIERELFEAIKKNPNSNETQQLQCTYSRYLVL